MKKPLLLILALLFTSTAQADFSPQVQSQIGSMRSPNDYPEELQKLGKYIDETLDEVKAVGTSARDNCPTQSIFAFNAMEMRQKGFDYNDIYYLLSVSSTDDLTEKGQNKLAVYKEIFEEAYYYPTYDNKDDQNTAITLYRAYKDHQCMLGVQ